MAIKTKTPRAREWKKAQENPIVKNETYAGTRHYGKRNRIGDNAPDYQIAVDVPVILSREIFKQAQLKRRINARLAKRNTKKSYLLSSVVSARNARLHCLPLQKRIDAVNIPIIGVRYLNHREYTT